MTVEVDERGIILVNADGIHVGRTEGNTVRLTIVVPTEEDALRLYRSLCASIDVKCVHLHFEGEFAGKEEVPPLNKRN